MYRTVKELKYYGSDFNKFLNSLSKEMTVINIDCLQYKRSKKALRLIEYKHSYENIPVSQLEVLRVLANLLTVNNSDRVHDVGVYVVKGNHPFDRIEVRNLIDNSRFVLEGNEVKQWCEFRVDLGRHSDEL